MKRIKGEEGGREEGEKEGDGTKGGKREEEKEERREREGGGRLTRNCLETWCNTVTGITSNRYCVSIQV